MHGNTYPEIYIPPLRVQHGSSNHFTLKVIFSAIITKMCLSYISKVPFLITKVLNLTATNDSWELQTLLWWTSLAFASFICSHWFHDSSCSAAGGQYGFGHYYITTVCSLPPTRALFLNYKCHFGVRSDKWKREKMILNAFRYRNRYFACICLYKLWIICFWKNLFGNFYVFPFPIYHRAVS